MTKSAAIHIDFQSHCDRSFWAQARTDTAKFRLDSLLKFERVTPESLIIEGLETEGLASLIKHTHRG